MSWIESHEDIADHWKTDCFRTELGISVPEAVGHLHLLWHFTLRVAWRDGDLVKYTDQAIASGARWGGDASAFISALRKAHFLDGKAIHNWRDFCGELINKRISNENRRSERFRKDAGTMPEHYRNNAGTLPVKVTPTVPTLPYPTEPKDKDIPDVANGATSPPLAGDVAESKPNKTENVQNVHLLVDIWNRKAHPNLPRSGPACQEPRTALLGRRVSPNQPIASPDRPDRILEGHFRLDPKSIQSRENP